MFAFAESSAFWDY